MKKLIFLLILSAPFLIFAETNSQENKSESQVLERIQNEMIIYKLKSIPFEGFTDDIINQFQPDSGYYNIALGFAQVGNFKKALKNAKKIDDNNEKNECLSLIVFEMYSDGLEDKALTTIDKINQPYFVQQAFRMIIDDMINNKNYIKALQYGLTYQDEYNLIKTKLHMITTMLKNNEIDKAKEFFQFIKAENKIIDLVFLEIVKFYIMKNNINGFYNFMKETYTKITNKRKEIIISQAIRNKRSHLILDQLDSLDDITKDREYAKIACKYVKEYKFDKANELLKKIENDNNRDLVYTEFITNSIEDKKFDRAVSYIDSINLLENKDLLYRKCSKSYIDIGNLENAIELSKKINNTNRRERTIAEIALYYFKTGDMQKFNIQEKEIKTLKARDYLYSEIIDILLKRNNIENIELYTNKITEERTKNHALSLIVMKYIYINDFDKARYFIYQITDDYVRKQMFLSVKDK
jgi:tetratricopeptide (TPR) repeat protein